MNTVFSALLSAPDIMAAFTTRHGGISDIPYTSANLAFHVGDNPLDVLHNHDKLASALGYQRERLIHMRQIHSDRVTIATEDLTFDTPPECDALITNRSDTPLMVMSADCTPILLHDPVHHAIGAVHAGRAGALNAILPKTINKMREIYGTSLRDLRISMGPSIHGCCYEVNTAIAEEVKRRAYPHALRFEEEKVFLDVNTILTTQLKELGIQTDQFELISACTACECETYFSYRADQQKTGRIAGVIMLRS